MNLVYKILTLIILALLVSCGKENTVEPALQMQLASMRVGTENIIDGANTQAPTGQPLVITFSASLDKTTVDENIRLVTEGNEDISLSISYLDDDKTISATPESPLTINSTYTATVLDGIRGINGEQFNGISVSFTTFNPPLEVLSLTIDGLAITNQNRIQNISTTPEIIVHFSEPIGTTHFENKIFLTSKFDTVTPEITKVQDSVYSFAVSNDVLENYEKYRFYLSPSIDYNGQDFEGYSAVFHTEIDSTFKFPEISDEDLLTKVQEQTFKYFWDYAHPVSGLTRERFNSGETVTTGGSGFGLMAILVGIERGFITRAEGVDRLETIIDFLSTADRFHGVWSHWINGSTGKTIPFGTDDDGGDLVETAFMIQGMIAVRQYLDNGVAQEAAIIEKINTLCDEVEWDWYTQGGQNVLYWHWSPNVAWKLNHRIVGWNEALIVYVLAAASTTHTVDAQVYHNGWAGNGGIRNNSNNSYYDITLDMRTDRGGPLFFAHYSHLGLDPRNLTDQYANYWNQSVNHTLINRAYCIQNPLNWIGYHEAGWGLTASDNHEGYSAHSPDNDKGVITPTAALSSFPYTPDESMQALRYFYYILGDRLWGEYGFYDAYNITEGWTADSYLAIDQGPIIVMIENHRSALIWDLFMSAPEVQAGLDKLGFSY